MPTLVNISSLAALQSTPLSPSPTPEPEIRIHKNKKRKPNFDEEIPDVLVSSRKRGHNVIEKRYRTNLNEKINCLREGIPALRPGSGPNARSIGEGADLDGYQNDEVQHQKYGKAAILGRALEYIKHLEAATQRLGGDVNVLQTRVEAFEKLSMFASIVVSGNRCIAPSRSLAVNGNTLESVQSDFQQVKPVCKPPVSTSSTRDKVSKQSKVGDRR
ncbi:sterol regulatory element binding protein sre1 [Phlyctema vagabunda]|uniref:Sterol regulatory element binding protein sre1 n=1 Tax=Phlyctema vagabunda TaxID=108571 RepID=A0ABR4P5R9_9HELO